jgi:hypothetical protein
MVANKVQIKQQMVSLRSSESWFTGQQAGQRDILKVKCRCLITVPQQVQGTIYVTSCSAAERMIAVPSYAAHEKATRANLRLGRSTVLELLVSIIIGGTLGRSTATT